ncbi:metallophosphoesterase [Patescibacteria group bacterium]
MTTLVISDLHLGKRFNKRKFDFLTNLFSKYQKILLNGDFWDYYSLSFNDFVNSKWNKLFPLMKDKTIYIYGNHDKKKWSDKRVNLFSKIQTQEYRKLIGNKKFIFRHGHIIDEFKQNESDRFVRLVRKFRLAYLGLLYDYMFTLLSLKKEKKIKMYAKSLASDEVLFLGHKHAPVINIKDKYVFGGYVMFGKACFFEINNDGNANLTKTSY